MTTPIRGEVTRDYYSSDYFTLPPDEPRRTADPFVEKGNPCPKCGYSDRIIWYYSAATRCIVAECRCGYLKEQYIGDAMPMTDEMLERGVIRGGIALLDRTCTATLVDGTVCGREFKTRADRPKEVCQRCRQRHTDTAWRESHPEQYQETQNKWINKAKEKKAKKKEAAKNFL